MKKNAYVCPYTYEERKIYGEQKRLEERAREQSAACEFEVKCGLPELEGSESQIAWAMVIRHKALEFAIGPQGLKPEFLRDGSWIDLPEIVGKDILINAVMYCIHKILPLIEKTSAKWWIDNRENIERIDSRYIIAHWGEVYNAELTKQAKAEELAILKAKIPPRPKVLQDIFDKYPDGAKWNCAIYGKEKYGYRIYVNSDEYKITKEEKESLETYRAAKDAYTAAKKELG